MMLLLGTGAASAQTNLSVIDGRISQLEDEIRRLTGKIEEQSFQIKQLETELERRVSDAEIRLGDLEKNPSMSGMSGNSSNGSTSSSYNSYNNNPIDEKPMVDQADISPWQTPKTSGSLGQVGNNSDNATSKYETAFATLRNGNYDLAEVQFQEFLDQNPNHTLKINAQYWLAETYYVRNQYDKAAKGFATAYQGDPNGSKAPDNLLKLGLSLAGLGKNEDACVALAQLLNDFKSGPRSIIGRAERETTRLGCS